MTIKIFTHSNPVWSEKANFIIGIPIVVKGRGDSDAWEQLWSKQILDRHFEICCIPFFAYNLALGDEVETDNNYMITSVIKPSGHYTFRIWLGSTSDNQVRLDILRDIERIGCLFEWYSDNLVGVDAESEAKARSISSALLKREKLGQIVYETGKT